jgi:hypothetical protein
MRLGDRSRRAALTLTLTALAAGPAAGALADGTSDPAQTPSQPFTVMIAKTTKSRQSVQAKQGSYCLPNANFTGGICHTATFPLPDVPVVKVSAGEEITLLFKVPVGYVTWRTARLDGPSKREVITANGEGDQVTKTKKRWRITLPKKLRKSSTIVGVSVTYANAYNSFEFGISVR